MSQSNTGQRDDFLTVNIYIFALREVVFGPPLANRFLSEFIVLGLSLNFVMSFGLGLMFDLNSRPKEPHQQQQQ